jgi:hypothetical protein
LELLQINHAANSTGGSAGASPSRVISPQIGTKP